jgi:uncharacterized protein
MPGWEFVALYIALGIVVGTAAGMLGIGGGGILVPSLTSIFLMQKMPQSAVVHMALGTSMATIVVTSFFNTIAHHKLGDVLWTVVRVMIPGILLGAFAATFLVSHLSSLFLSVFFSIFMAYVAVQMFLNKKPKPGRTLLGSLWQMFAGFVIGAVSAMVSIGGASLSVPYLVWQNTGIQKAIGTAAAIGFPVAVSATVGYMISGWHNTNMHNLTFGYVSLPAFVIISVCSSLMVPVGAKFSHKLPVGIIKKIFGLLLVALSLKMLSTFL